MKLVRYNAEEWSALYVDGDLRIVGDSYLIDEEISTIYGVEEIDSDVFLRGGNTREDVAKTLDEVYNYQEQQNKNLQEAEKLRAEANKLMEMAKALEKG